MENTKPKYRRWLIAKGNVFFPSGAGIVKLVDRLRKEKWIPDPATGAAWKEVRFPLEAAWLDHPDRADLFLRWPALRSPLAGAASPTLELHRGDDFVYPEARGIGAIDSECACGEDLAFAWDDDDLPPPFGRASGIFTECSECSRTFDPARHEADIVDPRTGQTSRVRGGAAYRFAIVAASAEVAAFDPELVAACEAEFGRSFYEVGAAE